MSMGDSMVAGFEAMSNAKARKKQNDLDKLRLDFEVDQKKKELDQQKELTNRRIDFEADQASKNREFQSGESEKNRSFQGGESDKNRQFQGGENQKNRDATAANLQTQIGAEAPERTARTNMYNAQSGAMAAKDPNLATVEQPMDPMNPNGGKITARVPMSQLGQFQKPAAQYQSPYSDAINAVQKEITDHQVAMAKDPKDTATGPFNLWGDRQAKIAQKQRQLVNLQGLEINDRVEKGLITKEEGEALAQKLKTQNGIK